MQNEIRNPNDKIGTKEWWSNEIVEQGLNSQLPAIPPRSTLMAILGFDICHSFDI
jgi:hypothetical protein